MCDMPHAILLIEGTLRSSISPETALRAHVLRNRIAAVAVPAGRIDKSNNELSVHSMRRMDSGMSHLILSDGATFSYTGWPICFGKEIC